MTPKTRSEQTTESSTHSARPSNNRARGGSAVTEENVLLRDLNRWITVIVLPILLTSMFAFGTWVVNTINASNTSIAVMQEQIRQGQTQRQADSTTLQGSVVDLKTAISALTSSIDGLKSSQATQAANLAVLMDQRAHSTAP